MLVNIQCLVQVCKKLKINFRFVDNNHNVVQISIGNNRYYFANWTTPYNKESDAYIFQDKEFTYQLLKDKVRLPRTLGFLDPDIEEKRKEYLNVPTYEKIVEEIQKNFGLPVVIKKNKGAGGLGVFKCTSKDECLFAIKHVFDKTSKDYDYVVLGQEYIPIVKEYRVVVFKNEIVFAYLKDVEGATFVGNLSPLHWEGSRAVLVEDTISLESFNVFLKPVFSELPIGYAGFDLAEDSAGKLWLLEINSKPSYDYYVRDNRADKLLLLYEKMLESLREEKLA